MGLGVGSKNEEHRTVLSALVVLEVRGVGLSASVRLENHDVTFGGWR